MGSHLADHLKVTGNPTLIDMLDGLLIIFVGLYKIAHACTWLAICKDFK